MRLLLYSMGPGETAQAYAVAKAATKIGIETQLVVRQKVNLSFVSQESNVHVSPAETIEALVDNVLSYKPNAILICNSRAMNGTEAFIEKSPFPDIPTFTLDSDWLFDESNKFFNFLRWSNQYFVNLPEAVFRLGLKENGGFFSITPWVLEKIKVVGVIPSYSPIDGEKKGRVRRNWGIGEDEKLIFCYYSGFGASPKSWIVESLFSALREMSRPDVRVMLVGDRGSLPLKNLPDWAFFVGDKKEVIDSDSFYELLASSDLVFQHQGLGTLEQAISAQVPAIANVKVNVAHNGEYPELHLAEVGPFEKSGLCKMLTKESPLDNIKGALHELLYSQPAREKMMKAQEAHSSPGEEVVLQSIVSHPSVSKAS